MGADGGIIWIPIKKPYKRNIDRAAQLIKPFWKLLQFKNSDWQEIANDKFIDENPWLIYSNEYLYGTYGSFQDISLLSLRDALEENWSDNNLTFLELIEDFKTRPFFTKDASTYKYAQEIFFYEKFIYGNVYGSEGRKVSVLEALVYEHLKYFKDEELEKELGALAHMRVQSWIEELNSCLEKENLSCQETWT